MTWKQICADPVVSALDYRVESDEWGNIVMSPAPGMSHSLHQSRIADLLGRLLRGGHALTGFPVRTARGVKGVDVVWISDARLAQQPRKEDVAINAPEICVEVCSPRNRRGEIDEKKRLYFEKGAGECWTCSVKEKISFFDAAGPMAASKLCLDFPVEVSGL